ncbi:zinc transporter ZIP3-like [Pollicipes pollicipes]|uniref:zinc transporter ZIP3-like n=1 Tax=Pollicipes pollicipes TaxID=41117 RepID=UPI001885351B|nr:zinc transporter ZIP3-like [Pollicipes pollicipes]
MRQSACGAGRRRPTLSSLVVAAPPAAAVTMDILVAQILGILVIFLVTTTIGVLPGVLMRRNASAISVESRGFRTVLSVANSLASGVFLDLCFLGLIPMVQELFSKLWVELEVSVHYPVGEALVLVGFFLILTVENFAIWLQGRGQQKPEPGMRALSIENIADVVSEAAPRTTLPKGDDREDGGEAGRPLTAQTGGKEPNGVELQVMAAPETSGQGHSHGAVLAANNSGLRFLMLLSAISLHSLFEGMAIGLQVSMSVLLNLLLAILIHESLVGLAIGVKIAQQKVSFWKSLRLICAFTTMIPLGIGLGIALGTAEGATGYALSGTCQALAAGVFLHVTFMELVPDELEHSQNAFVSIACMFLGFSGMSLIVYLTE